MDLAELYQQVILDHNRNPRNFGPLPSATHHAQGYNPVCGDRVTVYVEVADSSIAAVAFEGSGCAISRASASLMTGAVKGKSVAEAEDIFRRFHGLVTADPVSTIDSATLGKLAALGGVRAFPSRIKCATLAWHALRAALAEAGKVTTE